MKFVLEVKESKAIFFLLLQSLKEDLSKCIARGNQCYKIRMAISSKGKGKSGGARVISCFKIVQQTVFLLTIFDKSEQESISNKELSELLTLID
jgi:hypothetical protein